MNDTEIVQAAELFKMFADATRIKILLCLLERERCVGEIVEQVGATQTAVSHQLRALRQKHLVRCRREGKNMIYAIADDHIKLIMETAKEHIRE